MADKRKTKTGRNHPCPCGKIGPEGRPIKFKRCCGQPTFTPSLKISSAADQTALRLFQQREASEKIRERQQGLGSPIVSFEHGGNQFVAVKNKFTLGRWKTFPDFLGHYIKSVLDPEWGNAELAKPIEHRHPILQWYEAYCKYQQKCGLGDGTVKSAPITGVVACYLMLAYNLYLIDHNVELQSRLIARLKNRSNFQGAYYELIIASILIRAGFELTLLDETSRTAKHCEFSAMSKLTGEKYWIEAKMKGVSGILGKTDDDGSKNSDPLSHLVHHIAAAISKPAADKRMIFVDLNTPLPKDCSVTSPTVFIQAAEKRMERYSETTMPADTQAYVFVTCFSYHHDLDGPSRSIAFPYGLGLPEFNFRGPMRISERYKQDRRHADAIAVGRAIVDYLAIPTTFDGTLPSEKFEAGPHFRIGSTYSFVEDNNEVIGIVTDAAVSEGDKSMFVGLVTPAGKHLVCKFPMTDGQLHDYLDHRDEYFGIVRPAVRSVNTPIEMFEWLIEANKNVSRQTIIDWFGVNGDLSRLRALTDEDLLFEYCEALAIQMFAYTPEPFDLR